MIWVPDPAHSTLEFAVKHMMISTVRGRFTRFGGIFDIDDEQPERSRIQGTIETASLDSGDAARDGHLKSVDFFDVEKYPAITFQGTQVQRVGDDRFKVVGDVTIRDVTRDVVFDVVYEGRVKDIFGVQRLGFTAQTTLNRKDFGLNWNMMLEAGGWAVGDQVRVTFEVEAIPQQATAAAHAEAGAEAQVIA